MCQIPKKLVFVILFIQLIIIALLVFTCYEKPEEVVYCIDNQRLFDGFQMTKEVRKDGEKEFNQLKKTTDSLYSLLQQQNINTALRERISQNYVASKERFEIFNQNFATNEIGKIWERISSYSNEYCNSKGYTIVIGKETSKDIIYSDKKRDLTDELLTYINSRYAGKE